MNEKPKYNTDNEMLGDALGNDSSAAKPINFENEKDIAEDIEKAEHPEDGTDKYLALEQPGVTYTEDTNPTENSDFEDYSGSDSDDTWSEEGGNSKNSDAFNQDDYILEDNIDLDEDQNQSISSDDDDFEESNERYTN